MPSPPSLFPELTEQSTRVYTTGILPSQELRAFIAKGVIGAQRSIEDGQIQPASVDLRLGAFGFELDASFLPHSASSVEAQVATFLSCGHARRICLREGFLLKPGTVYLVPLQEVLRLPSNVSAKANPKSTTGRLDVFARVISDRGSTFDHMPAGYRGSLYVELFSRTFPLVVREGSRVVQIRLVQGSPPPSDAAILALHHEHPLAFQATGIPAEPPISRGLWLSVDLTPTDTRNAVAYRARSTVQPIDYDKPGHYSATDYWEALPATSDRTLKLEPDAFYVLVSKEHVVVPSTHAAEMVPYDPSFGEFRVHYAGFFDPGFGYAPLTRGGTRAVLEVRSHGIPFLLEDNQPIARLVYQRLVAPPTHLYGTKIGSAYHQQDLALSKHFAPSSY